MPYERRNRKFGEGQSQGRGTSVIVGEAVLESVGGRKPTSGPPVSAKRVIRPSDISVGEAILEPREPASPPSTLRDAERRRYGKQSSRRQGY